MRALKFFCVLVLLGSVFTPAAYAQSLSLDDNPMAPITTPPPFNPVAPFGVGAEDEFGAILPWLAPSPSLPVPFSVAGPPNFDGTIFSPALPHGFPPPAFTPNGSWIDAFSTNHAEPRGATIPVDFSVDRMGTGVGALGVESAANQQPGDVYRSTVAFPNPAQYVSGLPPGPGWVGVLPSAGVAGGSNTLLIDESVLGLTVTGAPGVLTLPGIPVAPPQPRSHDNLDGYDHTPQIALPGGGPGVYPVWTYFAVWPLEAADVNAGGLLPPISAADIFDVMPFTPVTSANPYAAAATIGLDFVGGLNTDSIDGLVVFDLNIPGGPANQGPGAEPGIDFALFSLAPGSATLAQWNLDAADVFFTDFTGAFATYAFATDLGIAGGPGGPPFGRSNIDALEIPEPSTLVLAAAGALLGLLACAWRKRRRR